MPNPRYRERPHAVVTYPRHALNLLNEHDRGAREMIALRIAGLLGVPFDGAHDSSVGGNRELYFVPGETLSAGEAMALGIDHPSRLFGGVVPHPFVATKSITHHLLSMNAARPEGWSTAFPDAVKASVIRGFTTFALDDAYAAAIRMLRRGPVRIKQVRATAGLGQHVVQHESQLPAVLEVQDKGEVGSYGIVIEENLYEVTTYSVGSVTLGGHQISYWGTQRLTRNNLGKTVYGGSDLNLVRGDFDRLLATELETNVRRSIKQARHYDQMAAVNYPGLFASRRNYDVIEGNDVEGHRCSGVLEQSWRVGGASGAEIAAFEAFDMDPTRTFVRSSTMEIYGDTEPPPGHATIYYQGTDPIVGKITKYSVIEP